MNTQEKVNALLNIARKAPVPAEVHDQCLEFAKEIFSTLEKEEKKEEKKK